MPFTACISFIVSESRTSYVLRRVSLISSFWALVAWATLKLTNLVVVVELLCLQVQRARHQIILSVPPRVHALGPGPRDGLAGQGTLGLNYAASLACVQFAARYAKSQ
ncbi:hypothetical protein T492DRAFT_425487 [Pavlovales sp. CCMP2436]|nr:hypothetical protein T492DRAFT_425487 [Pavlovales sp. CCMP2436]